MAAMAIAAVATFSVGAADQPTTNQWSSPTLCGQTINGQLACTTSVAGHDKSTQNFTSLLWQELYFATEELAVQEDCLIDLIGGQGPDKTLTLINGTSSNLDVPNWYKTSDFTPGLPGSTPRFVAVSLPYDGIWLVVTSWVDAFANYQTCSYSFMNDKPGALGPSSAFDEITAVNATTCECS